MAGYRGLMAVAYLLIAATAQGADPPATAPSTAFDASVAFGAREGIKQISLSPDGSKVAFVAPLQGKSEALVVRDIADGATPRAIFGADAKPSRLAGCGWVSNSRLVCSTFGVADVEGRKVGFSRVFAINADGSGIQLLSTRENAYSRGIQLSGGKVVDWLPDEQGAVLMARYYLPDDHTGSNLGSSAEGLGVDRIDTRTLAKRPVEPPRRMAFQYTSDGRGTVRVMGVSGVGSHDELTGIDHYYYRRSGSRTWEKLSDHSEITGEGFDPYAVDYETNVAYGLKKKNGRDALYAVKLDGSLAETLIFERSDVDIDGVSMIGRRHRVIGASYQTDVREVAYFDPQMKKLADALRRATPNTPNIRVVDSSVDERKLLIFAGADNDPGAYYLLDRDKSEMHVFLAARPELVGHPLATMKPMRYPAADGTLIPAYLTLPPGKTSATGLPAIVMPHGGPADRDEWGFDWLPQFYAAQGYVVIQPEFRGSSGYGDAWFQKNGFQSWRTAVGDVIDAGRWLVAQKIADPGRLFIVGWSYGGYAALQSAVVAPDMFKAVVAIAPVTDLAALKSESSGWTDQRIRGEFIGSGPEIREGSPAQNAGRIKAPVLLVHGTMDANVAYAESTLMAGKLRAAGGKVELITFPGLDHQLEDSAARASLLARSDAFMQAAVK